MPVISVCSRKGGVGKSTITAHLAAELLDLGHAVAVLDADTVEQSLVTWAGFGEGILSAIVQPADASHPKRFQKQVQDAQERAEYVLIDTPPSHADEAIMAAFYSDLVIVPAGASPLEVNAAANTVQMIRDEIHTRRETKRPLIAALPYKIEARSKVAAGLPDALKSLKVEVLPQIRKGAAVVNATIEGLTLVEYSPTKPVRQDFQAVAKQTVKLAKKGAKRG